MENVGTNYVGQVRSFFELLCKKDIDAWIQLWHPDAKILVFYPPEGFGSSIQGASAISSAFRGLFNNFQSFDAVISDIYPAADSDAVVVEYRNRAILRNGSEYTNSNIAVFRFRQGLISAYHDYFDPRRFQEVVDALS